MDKKRIEFVDSQKEKDELKVRSFKDIINGSILTRGLILKNLGFVIWLTFLGIVYIGNRYHSERVARTMTSLQREVKDLRAESISIAADLMNKSRRSNVINNIKRNNLPLEESLEPPKKIKK